MRDDYDYGERSGHWLPSGRDLAARRARNMEGIAAARAALAAARQKKNSDPGLQPS